MAALPLKSAASPVAACGGAMMDLMERLHFAPENGRIWLDDQRMMLVRTSAIGVLRRELIEGLGIERARGLLTRMGYHSGSNDADLARRLRPHASHRDMFNTGPQLHALEGSVQVETVRLDIDIERGEYYGEFLWHGSSESEDHVGIYGIGHEPACWTQVGYACGYTSTFMGRPILFREVECVAQGHSACRVIGRPIDEWDDFESDSRFLQAEPFIRGLSALSRTPSGMRPSPEVAAMFDEKDIVGVSVGFNAVCHKVRRVADTNATVLFLGDSGVGKEVFARTLHRISARATGPFVAINCAAIPEALVESELFGVEKGAFTGATSSRPGRFERANGGTLFLDEIGILNLTSQGKLLRALQEGEIERVGDSQVRKIDVRVVAATNLDLKAEVKAGRFREDLYFRLNVFPIKVPPLRERRADIPILMDHFLARLCRRHKREVTGFTARAIDALLTYEFPGNIRELENMIERGVIMAPNRGAIDVPDLFSEQDHAPVTYGLRGDGSLGDQDRLDQAPTGPDTQLVASQIHDLLSGGTCEALGTSLRDIEKNLEGALVDQAIEQAQGNISAAARLLGLTRSGLIYRMSRRKQEDIVGLPKAPP